MRIKDEEIYLMIDIGKLIGDLRDKQKLATADDRLTIWRHLQEDYCPECGYHKGDTICHCTNDE